MGLAAGGDAARGKPVMKLTVQFADGTSEEHVLQNAEHFADALRARDVPLQRRCGRLHRPWPAPLLRAEPRQEGAALEIVLESYDNDIVPTTVAITAGDEPVAPRGSVERVTAPQAAPAPVPRRSRPKAGGKGDAPLPETKPIVWPPNKTRVLVIGGGSSHNFGQFFGGTDVATLNAAGFSVNYTEDRDQAAAELGNADVARDQRQPPVLRHARVPEGAVRFRRGRQGPGDAAPWHLDGYSDRPELNADDRRRRRSRSRQASRSSP